MRTFILGLILAISIFGILEATNQAAIRGGKVTVIGGYLAVGPTEVAVSVSTSTTGQCIGILCGVTHAD